MKHMFHTNKQGQLPYDFYLYLIFVPRDFLQVTYLLTIANYCIRDLHGTYLAEIVEWNIVTTKFRCSIHLSVD